METAGESLTLTFMSADGVTDFMGEGVWSMVCQYDATYSNGERETLNELYIKFLGGPMYHDCGNQMCIRDRPCRGRRSQAGRLPQI